MRQSQHIFQVWRMLRMSEVFRKNEPVRDVVETVSLRSKQEVDRESGRSAWCSLHYAFSYHISDKENRPRWRAGRLPWRNDGQHSWILGIIDS